MDLLQRHNAKPADSSLWRPRCPHHRTQFPHRGRSGWLAVVGGSFGRPATAPFDDTYYSKLAAEALGAAVAEVSPPPGVTVHQVVTEGSAAQVLLAAAKHADLLGRPPARHPCHDRGSRAPRNRDLRQCRPSLRPDWRWGTLVPLRLFGLQLPAPGRRPQRQRTFGCAVNGYPLIPIKLLLPLESTWPRRWSPACGSRSVASSASSEVCRRLKVPVSAALWPLAAGSQDDVLRMREGSDRTRGNGRTSPCTTQSPTATAGGSLSPHLLRPRRSWRRLQVPWEPGASVDARRSARRNRRPSRCRCRP